MTDAAIPKKVLQIIEGAYRVTIEEQDDPALWITNAMRGAGGIFSVVLCANAVNYAVVSQDASGLQFAGWRQTQPPRLQDDVLKLIEKGVPVYVVSEDMAERGLVQSELVVGLSWLARADLPKLCGDFDQIWHW